MFYFNAQVFYRFTEKEIFSFTLFVSGCDATMLNTYTPGAITCLSSKIPSQKIVPDFPNKTFDSINPKNSPEPEKTIVIGRKNCF